MLSATPYTFAHGDLDVENLIVKDENLVGIIDWEVSGYFPVWWEFTASGLSLGEANHAWQLLLLEHIEDYTEAYEFWKDCYRLSKLPDLDERGAVLWDDLESEKSSSSDSNTSVR
ncbi:hypothetical protein CSOJ01_15068 [Colletotrichum sojae]|uniref:Aminoglycoside phosphotransferase domain-containing protein n=1 Tax=Colletotrichum sojae TaxID=2175907 RepID=A0A8H6MJ34_9PEZI|nr:hypothetical protein CSOJ01_15068 [Colletotrichum sojae]